MGKRKKLINELSKYTTVSKGKLNQFSTWGLVIWLEQCKKDYTNRNDRMKRKEYMKIKVMPLDTQTFTTYECDDFEFRSNNVCNWISITKDGKEIAFIERVGVIKTISHTET